MSGWTNSQRDGKFDSISHAGGKIRGAILTGAGRKTLHPRTLLSLCLSPQAAVVGLGSPMYFALNFAIVCLLSGGICCDSAIKRCYKMFWRSLGAYMEALHRLSLNLMALSHKTHRSISMR